MPEPIATAYGECVWTIPEMSFQLLYRTAWVFVSDEGLSSPSHHSGGKVNDDNVLGRSSENGTPLGLIAKTPLPRSSTLGIAESVG